MGRDNGGDMDMESIGGTWNRSGERKGTGFEGMTMFWIGLGWMDGWMGSYRSPEINRSDVDRHSDIN